MRAQYQKNADNSFSETIAASDKQTVKEPNTKGTIKDNPPN